MNEFNFMDRIDETIVSIDGICAVESDIIDVVNEIVKSYKIGGKVIIFGNGGSAADAQHFAAELVCKYKMSRLPIPAIALTTDTSIITAWSNDEDFKDVFCRQVDALAYKGDVVIGISTSGLSQNVIKALECASKNGTYTVMLTGGIPKTEEFKFIDKYIKTASIDTPVIQESHIVIIHMICDMVERALFEST